MLDDFSSMYMEEGKYAEAEPLFTRLVTVEEKVFGPEGPILAQTLPTYAEVERKLGRAKEADQLDARAKAIAAKSGFPSKAGVTKEVKPKQGAASKGQ